MTETPVPPPPPPPSIPPPTAGYPVSLAFEAPGRIARWRPLLHWLLAIPHFVILYVIGIVAYVIVVIAWFSGVLTGRIPDGLLKPLVMYQRYNVRVSAYLLFLREEYPPFAFDGAFTDPGDYPGLRLDVAPDVDGRNRLTIFFRYFMVIPHFVVLFFVMIAAFAVIVIGWFAVIILGRWPAGLEGFVVGVVRWSTRLNAYFYLLTDEYPPFSLS